MSSPIMKYFAYEHLPPKLQEVSKPIGELAKQMDDSLPDGAEKSAGLRKLLEAKDCLVRALLPMLFIALLLCASSADACDRCGLFGNRCAFKQVQAVHVQQLAAPIIYPQVNYFVGAPIRVEAIVQKSLQENPEYAEFQRFRAWKQELERKPTVGEPLNKPTENIPQIIPTSLLTIKCGTCHGGDAPKKGLLLDGTAKLNCEQVLKAMKAIQSGAMPPKNKLTPEEAGNVFHELLDLSER